MANEIDLVIGKEAFDEITRLITRLGDVDTKLLETATKFSNIGKIDPKNTSELEKLITENTNLTKIISQQSKDYDVLNKKLAEAAVIRTSSTKGITAEIVAQRELNKETTLGIKAGEGQAQTYAQLDARHKIAVKNAQDEAVANGRGTVAYQNYVKQANEVGKQLRVIDTDIGKHTRNVGNYASSWNGLGNSVNQITREAPAFANSLATGFMALSNNIPILTDELGVLVQKNKDLQSEGKPTESILKTVAGAFFSWQTAISLGVTLLTVYGAKLVEMAMGMGDVKKQLEDLDRLQKKYNNNLDNTTRTILHQAQLAKDKALIAGKSQEDINKIDEDALRQVLANNIKYRDYGKQLVDEEGKRILKKYNLTKTGLDLENDTYESLSKKRIDLEKEIKSNSFKIVSDFSGKNQELLIRENKNNISELTKTNFKINAINTLNESKTYRRRKAFYANYSDLTMKAGLELSTLTSAQRASEFLAQKKLDDKSEKKQKKILDFDEVKSEYDLAEAKLNTLRIEESSVDMSNWTTAKKIENLDKLSVIEIDKLIEIADKEIELSKEQAITDFTANKLALTNKTISLEKYNSNKKSIEERNANEIKTVQVKLDGELIKSAVATYGIKKNLNDKDLASAKELAIIKMGVLMSADKKIADNADGRVKYSMEQREIAFKAYIEEAKKKLIAEEELQLFKEKDPERQKIITENFKIAKQGLEDLLSPTEAARKSMMELFKSGNDKTLESTLDRLGASSLKTFLSIEDNGKSAFQNMWNTAEEGAEGAKQKTAIAVQAISAVTKDAFAIMQASSDSYYQGEFARLESQKQAAIAFAGDSEFAKADVEEKFAKKKKELEIKQFKDKQKMSVANIVISTAEAVMMAWATMAPPAAAIAMPIIAGLSLVEIGMVLAQKPPAYAEGTDNHSGGLMLVNDGSGSNFQEKVVLPSGKVIMPQGRNVLMDAPKGTKVLNHEQQLFEMLQNNNISMSTPIQNGLTYEEMNEIFQSNFANIKTQNTIFDKNGFQSYVRNGNSITRSNSNRSQSIGISV